MSKNTIQRILAVSILLVYVAIGIRICYDVKKGKEPEQMFNMPLKLPTAYATIGTMMVPTLTQEKKELEESIQRTNKEGEKMIEEYLSTEGKKAINKKYDWQIRLKDNTEVVLQINREQSSIKKEPDIKAKVKELRERIAECIEIYDKDKSDADGYGDNAIWIKYPKEWAKYSISLSCVIQRQYLLEDLFLDEKTESFK
jgi:hypothetical protein